MEIIKPGGCSDFMGKRSYFIGQEIGPLARFRSEAKMSILMSMDKWTSFAPVELRGATIRPIPCAHARVVVTIDGRPYAGFADRAAAEEAIRLWSGEVTGGGFPTPLRDPATSGWAAVRGRTLAVLER